MFISKKELAARDERLRRAQEEIESLKQTIRELQSEVADDRICGSMSCTDKPADASFITRPTIFCISDVSGFSSATTGRSV